MFPFRQYGTDGRKQYRMYKGVSSVREVHDVVDHMDKGLFEGSFCKVTEDLLTADPNRCNVIHSDGAGTKSIIAYLAYKESGDPKVFHGIALDSVVMNLDDLACVGIWDRVVISSTVNRNARNFPGEALAALIEGTESFLQQLRDLGINVVGVARQQMLAISQERLQWTPGGSSGKKG